MTHPLERTRYDRIIEAFSLLGLASAFIPLFFYPELGPGTRIPVHFNQAGEVDGWAGRAFFWQLPLVAAAFYAGLTWLERYYKRFRYPVRFDPSEAGARAVYRLGVRMVRHLKLFLLLIFSFLADSSLLIALGKARGLNLHLLTLLFAALFLSVGVYFVKMLGYKE